MDALHRFTLELERYHDTLQCQHCLQYGQFVSHGFVYSLNDKTHPVGKRIFCSNRQRKSGCGRTRRFYLATMIPTFFYTTSHLFVFLSALINMGTIQQAYQAATNTADPRNAYRWLNKLWNKLSDYRSVLKTRTSHLADTFSSRSQRFQCLFPTLHALFLMLPHNPCAHYQRHKQTPFI